MALVVYDMGKRIETPMRPGNNRITPTVASKATSPVTDQHGEYSEQTAAYQQQSEHQPQPVAYVRDIMQTPVRWIRADASVGEGWQLIQQNNYHHIPVVDSDLKINAIFSQMDIVKHCTNGPIDWQQNILNFASRPVLCIAVDADIRQCARSMLDYNIGAMPVVNQDHILNGIITRSDILRVISHYGPMKLWA